MWSTEHLASHHQTLKGPLRKRKEGSSTLLSTLVSAPKSYVQLVFYGNQNKCLFSDSSAIKFVCVYIGLLMGNGPKMFVGICFMGCTILFLLDSAVTRKLLFKEIETVWLLYSRIMTRQTIFKGKSPYICVSLSYLWTVYQRECIISQEMRSPLAPLIFSFE